MVVSLLLVKSINLNWLNLPNKKFSHKPIVKDLVFIKDLIEAGKVVPVIDRRYPLSEVAEAVRYYGEGHPQGKVVINVEHDTR